MAARRYGDAEAASSSYRAQLKKKTSTTLNRLQQATRAVLAKAINAPPQKQKAEHRKSSLAPLAPKRHALAQNRQWSASSMAVNIGPNYRSIITRRNRPFRDILCRRRKRRCGLLARWKWHHISIKRCRNRCWRNIVIMLKALFRDVRSVAKLASSSPVMSHVLPLLRANARQPSSLNSALPALAGNGDRA